MDVGVHCHNPQRTHFFWDSFQSIRAVSHLSFICSFFIHIHEILIKLLPWAAHCSGNGSTLLNMTNKVPAFRRLTLYKEESIISK